MFCPQCKSEYRPGFKHCSDCDLDLVDRLPAERLHTGEDETRLVRLRSYRNDGEAFLALSVLESAGIEAIVSPPLAPEFLSRSFGVGLPGTDVYVRSEDFVEANEILTRVGPHRETRQT